MEEHKPLEILDADTIDSVPQISEDDNTDNEEPSETTPADIPINDEYASVGVGVGVGVDMDEKGQNKNTEEETTTAAVEPNEMALDEPGFLYNLLHILDDIYVYGRTVIENNYFNLADNADFNLVYPNIYIGNYSTSTNLELLTGLGITHIITVLPTFNPPFPDKFTYLHIPAYDDESQNIIPAFEKTNAFIENALAGKGKILLHCMVGRSRSVCIFIAFLIHVLQGGFNQSLVDITCHGDVSNEIEYNTFGTHSRANGANADGLIATNTNNNTKVLNMSEISRIEYTKPEFGNKYRNFMIYKKQTFCI